MMWKLMFLFVIMSSLTSHLSLFFSIILTFSLPFSLPSTLVPPSLSSLCFSSSSHHQVIPWQEEQFDIDQLVGVRLVGIAKPTTERDPPIPPHLEVSDPQ